MYLAVKQSAVFTRIWMAKNQRRNELSSNKVEARVYIIGLRRVHIDTLSWIVG